MNYSTEAWIYFGLMCLFVVLVPLYLAFKDRPVPKAFCRYCWRDDMVGRVHRCFAMRLAGKRPQYVNLNNSDYFVSEEVTRNKDDWQITPTGVLGKKAIIRDYISNVNNSK